MAPRKQVDEILDEVSAIVDMDQKISAMDAFMKKDPYLWELLKISVTPSLKIPVLPAGFPKRYKPDNAIPHGISDTNIRTEWRRIKNYLPNGSLQVVPPVPLEASWVAILQGVHWAEAEILTAMKDQNLLDKYPDLWVILPALGIATSINTSDEDAHPPEKLVSVEGVAESSEAAIPAKPEPPPLKDLKEGEVTKKKKVKTTSQET